MRATARKAAQAEAERTPLEEIDVSRPERFQQDSWQPWFKRLRQEAPVHHLKDSVNGPFWSVRHSTGYSGSPLS